jgi:hypothetical protein
MTSAVTLRPETNLDITTYWLVVDGDNVGTIAPLLKQLASDAVADYWIWRVNFPMMDMPDWCAGRAASLAQAKREAENAFARVRNSLSQADCDVALWKKDGKVRCVD